MIMVALSAEATLNLGGIFSMPVSAAFRMAHSNVVPTLVQVAFEYHLLAYLSSSSPVEHKATTMFRHKVLSLAEA